MIHSKKAVLKFLLSILISLTMIFPNLFAASLSTSSIGNVPITSTDDDPYFTWDNATVYFTMTDRFYNGNTSNDTSYGRVKVDATGKNIGTFHGGDVAGLTKKLKEGYFKNLGVNSIWMTAPYEQMHGYVGGGNSGDFAHYAYHGYYALDYTMMDKNMGTVAEMREFVDEAHSQGIRVILDIVMNHPGYLSMKDMTEYDIMPTNHSKSELLNWSPSNGQTWHSYHDLFLDYTGHNDAWAKWWSSGWIRAGVAGYTAGDNSELRMNLAGLPDFKTEVTSNQGLAPLLKTKWSQETSGYDNWIVPAAKSLRTDLGVAPTEYNIKWLAAWVREFGIDGFRVDTAKHVEPFRWGQLKDACNTALKEWRVANPTKAGANWDDDFWMTGEVYNTGVEYKAVYFETGKFDSLINFFFPKDGNLNTINNTYQDIASKVNTKDNWNVLSYISSHDEGLTRANMTNLGTALLLSPGGVQIFYGDETNRPGSETCSDKDQPSRSDMNWSSVNQSTLNHWQIIGTFRKNHPSIGAGTHSVITSSPYVFSRTYNKEGISDKVVVALNVTGSTTINVSSIFKDGTPVKDAYTGAKTTVANGSVTFTAGSAGVILIEQNGEEPLTPVVTLTPGNVADTTKYYTDTLDVKVALQNVTEATCMINGNEAYTVKNGDIITIGKGEALETTTKITVSAINALGTYSQTYSYLKTERKPVTVHFYKSADWSTPSLYYYNDALSLTGPKWPGVTMNSEGDNWYSYTLPAEYETAQVIFNTNNGTTQIPDKEKPGFVVEGEMWYKDGVWTSTNPDGKPSVTLTPGNSSTTTTYTSSTLSIKVILKNVISATCQIDNGEAFSVASGESFEIGKDVATGTITSIKVKAENEQGLFNGTFTYKKETVIPPTDITVHFYKPSSWGIPNLYYYETETKTGPKWPGEAMTSEGDGWYSYTIKDWTSAYVLFNSNDQQIPGAKEPGINVSKEVWYKDGVLYTSKPEEAKLTVHFYKPSGWSTPNLYYYETKTKTGPKWPGEAMTAEGNNWYSYTITGSSAVRTIFNSNGQQIPGANEPGIEVSKEIWYKDGMLYTSKPEEKVITVHFYNPSGWGTPNLYYYETESKTGPKWPGEAMTAEGINWYTYTIPSEIAVKVLFNSNNQQIPTANEPGFEVNGEMWYKDGTWTSSKPN